MRELFWLCLIALLADNKVFGTERLDVFAVEYPPFSTSKMTDGA